MNFFEQVNEQVYLTEGYASSSNQSETVETNTEQVGDKEIQTTVITKSNPDGSKTVKTIKTTTHPDGSSETETHVKSIGVLVYSAEPVTINGKESENVETFIDYEGDNQIKTIVTTKHNDDGSKFVRTERTSTAPDGTSHTEVKEEGVSRSLVDKSFIPQQYEESENVETKEEIDGDKLINTTITTKTEKDGSKTVTTLRTTTSPDGASETETNIVKLGPALYRLPTEIQKNGSETVETTTEIDGNKQIKTTVTTKRNKDGSEVKTTETTTTHADGTAHTETRVETKDAEPESNDNNNNKNSNNQAAAHASDLKKQTSLDKNIKSLEESIPAHHGSVEDLIKKKYVKDYSLTEKQFKMIKDYFDKLEKDGFIDITVLQKHLKQQLKDRKELVASDNDISRALNTIDSDHDGKIDFNEFVDLLSLFFASKHNLKTKILNVLVGHQFSHISNGILSSEESENFYAYLKVFYGVASSSTSSSLNEDDSQDETISSRMISGLSKLIGRQAQVNEPPTSSSKSNEIEFDQDLEYGEFVDKIYPFLESVVFVRW